MFYVLFHMPKDLFGFLLLRTCKEIFSLEERSFSAAYVSGGTAVFSPLVLPGRDIVLSLCFGLSEILYQPAAT
jgi:hypothetical protein